MEAIRSSESSVRTRATRRNIAEDCVLDLWYYMRTCLEELRGATESRVSRSSVLDMNPGLRNTKQQ
jgi:hypothetical protein